MSTSLKCNGSGNAPALLDAVTAVPSCPPWCDLGEGHAYTDPSSIPENNGRIHERGYFYNHATDGDPGQDLTLVLESYETRQTDGQLTLTPAHVSSWGEVRSTDPAQLREIGNAYLKAADELAAVQRG